MGSDRPIFVSHFLMLGCPPTGAIPHSDKSQIISWSYFIAVRQDLAVILHW